MDTRFRLALAASISLLPLVPLTYRLAYLQIFEHRSLDTRAAGEFSRSAEEIVPRADLLDRNGKILAQSIPVWTCFVDKRMMPALSAENARRLAAIFKVSPQEVQRRFRDGGRFAALRRDLSFEQSQQVTAAKIDGIGVSPSQQRYYPNGTLARGVLGQVSGDGRGIAGVELSLDKRLTGTARKLKVIRDGSGRMIYGSEQDTPAPEPVQLTIDRSVQYFAEEALEEAAKQYQMQEGMVIVQDPFSGDVLAMAAYPPDPLKNPIVQDTYEPGSTFKAVMAAASLDAGVLTPADQLFCENGAWQIAPGTIIHDHEAVGDCDLASILEHSSNIGAAKVGEKLGPELFYRYARAFGFASKTGVLLPGETAGELRPISQLNRVALGSSAFGYGVAVSPLQIVTAYSAIANGGILYQPRVLLDGEPPIRIRRVAAAQTMQTLVPMFENVVERAAVAARIPGYRVAGKTGTARRLDPVTKRYSTSKYNASFVGFLPASHPRWTILVVIEAPTKGSYYGAQVAAPVFGRIAKQLLAFYAVAPDKDLSPLARISITTGGRSGRPATADARPLRP